MIILRGLHKKRAVCFGIIFFLTFLFFNKQALAASSTLSHVESLDNTSTYNNSDISIGGWAINPSGMKSIDVSVSQGYYIVSQTISASSMTARPDVNAVYPSYLNSLNSGFSCTIDKNTIPVGSNTITIKFNGNDGSVQTFSKNITMLKPTPMVTVDYAGSQGVSGMIYGDISISGWSVDPSGVKSVTAMFDGYNISSPTYTQVTRNDVAAVYPQYPDVSHSGYNLSIPIDMNSLGAGAHRVTVVSTGNNGDVRSVNVLLTKATPQMNVESLNSVNNITSSQLTVSGWAINSSGVDHVAVSVAQGSHVVSQTIAASSMFTRSDVHAVYPAYINSVNSGFAANFDTLSLPGGANVITVTATGSDGTSQTFTKTVNIAKISSLIHVESLDSVSSYNNSDINVSGWAINASGIKNINVSVAQGSHNISQTIDASSMYTRSDVAAAYPGYTNSRTSGFSTTISKNNVPVGANTITLTFNGNDGSSQTFTKTINMIKPTPLMTTDFTNHGYLTNEVIINGWSLNASGVSQVTATIDGNTVGTASSYDRPDVEKAYPTYAANNPNSGFIFDFHPNLSQYPVGPHKLVVTSVGNDGGTTSNTFTLTKAAPIISPDPGSISPGKSYAYNASVPIVGWAVNASGLSNMKVYLDSTSNLLQTITTFGTRGDVLHAIDNDGNGGYSDAVHSGFSCSINLSSLSFGKTHNIILVTTGNDGSTSSVTIPIYISNIGTQSFNISLAQLAVDNGQPASTLDPASIWDSSSSGMYEFMNLNWVDGITADQVNAILLADHNRAIQVGWTGDTSNDALLNQGAAFLQAAKNHNINVLYLVAHTIVETGHGQSTLANGVYVPGNTKVNPYYVDSYGCHVVVAASGTYYNLFGIHAYDPPGHPDYAVRDGSEYAASQGWSSVGQSIDAQAAWIALHYTTGQNYAQNTLYEMKWDPYGWSKGSGYEYATDTNWADLISQYISRYSYVLNGLAVTYELPQFN